MEVKMSISFYIKNKKKFLGYETVLNVEEALTILNKELNTYNTRDIDINDLLLSPVSNYECLLIGEDKVSARGFELSYDNKNKDYAIRVFTPSSREDWLLALEYIKELAKKFNSEIVNEREEVYTVDNIDKFDYESDILYGIEVVSSNLKDKDIKVSSIYGINRVVSFNQEMIDKINNSDSPIDTFSNIIKEIQYLDAYSAHQQFYKNNEDHRIIGAYTLTQNLRTILPYEPSVEYENSNIVKNEEVSFWNIGFVVINGDENDPNSYQVAGQIDYDDFIKKLPINKNIEQIILPKGLTSLADQVFMDCTNLKTVSIPDTVISIGRGAFGDCTNLEEVELPKGLTEIKDTFFYGCKSLTKIRIPEGVQSVGYNAFEQTPIKEIIFPTTLKTLDTDVVAWCEKLEKIVFKGTTPPTIDYSSLKRKVENPPLKIYVPKGKKQTYINSSEEWKDLEELIVESNS